MKQQERPATDLVETPFAEISSARIRRFDLYWRSKMLEGRLPRREDIEPGEIKEILPHLLIVDLELAPFRVRYRLCGSAVSFYDEELTGAYLDAALNITPEERLRVERRYRAVQEERRPLFIRRRQLSRQTNYEMELQAGIWPLSRDGLIVDQCVAVEDFPAVMDT